MRIGSRNLGRPDASRYLFGAESPVGGTASQWDPYRWDSHEWDPILVWADAMGLVTLKRRAEFLRLRGGARWSTPAFILETRARLVPDLHGSRTAGKKNAQTGRLAYKGERRAGALQQHRAAPRFGFTITKRIGNAVTRNLIRRRLKQAVALLADEHARAGHDYVLIARPGAQERVFALVLQDLKTAFGRVHRPKGRAKPSSAGRRGGGDR